MFIIINKYTLTLAWIISPVLAVVYLVEGDTECSVMSLLIFIVGLTYMVAGHRAGWWPFRRNRPDYVVAQVYQPPNPQDPYYQQQYQQQPYQQQPYQQQDPYAGQGYQQYPDHSNQDPVYDEQGREIRQ